MSLAAPFPYFGGKRLAALIAAHTYAATYPGAPERTTRAQAERDMCQHRQEQTR